MHNGILIPTPDKPSAAEWSWRTRARAWVFGLGPEVLTGAVPTGITDGESYAVYRVFPAGVAIPTGEADRARRYAEDAAEFHLVQEMTEADVAAGVFWRQASACPAHAFWCERQGKRGKEKWRVCYVARKGTLLVDVLCLKDRIGPGARLFVAVKSFRMGVINAFVDKESSL